MTVNLELKHILLFGGSFNPVHTGHIILARAAMDQLKADACLFIPCAQSADGKKLAPGGLRLAWLKKALRNQPGMKAWDGELKRGGISRTIDTVRELSAPGLKLWVLMGADQYARLHTWKSVPTLRRLATFAVFARLRGGAASARLRPGDQCIQAPLFTLSSTQVRAALKAQKPCFSMLPAALQKDISLRRAYRTPALLRAA